MDELQIFSSDEFGSVRTLMVDGVPYFVGRDVAESLGYGNPLDAISKHVDDDDKGFAKCDTHGGRQNMVIINESGLYSLILSSKLPKARQFKKWVTETVLPSIRKNGLYATEELIANPALAIAALQALKAEREKTSELELLNAVQNQQIAEMKPKASYYDEILQNKDTVPISQIAKDYGMSGKKLNALLHELRIQYKLRNTWLLYQKYADQGYTQSRTFALECEKNVMHTYWTQKGRLFLYERLKQEGILPLIETEE